MNKWPSPGIHLDIPAEQYHALHGFSKSWMDKLRRSPAHLCDSIYGGQYEPTPAQKLGTAVHCCALENGRFKNEYAVGPNVSGVTKEYKDFKRDAEAQGKIVLSARDHNWCQAISNNVRANPFIQSVMKDDHWIEPSIVWDIDGYVCKCRPDLVSLRHKVIVDLKTTKDGSPSGFPKEIARYHYHTQAAWYMYGMYQATGEAWNTFLFIAAEKKRPFLSTVYRIDRGSATYSAGTNEYLECFDTYKRCMKSGKWPGYGDEAIPVELPDWSISSKHELEEEPYE
jgi:exodeoxyribonuclease VIII